MSTLGTWAMLLAVILVVAWLLWEFAHPVDGDELAEAMRRHPSAQHPDGDCDDTTCCVSIDQAAAMADAEDRAVAILIELLQRHIDADEMRVQDGELDDAELCRLVDEWSGR